MPIVLAIAGGIYYTKYHADLFAEKVVITDTDFEKSKFNEKELFIEDEDFDGFKVSTSNIKQSREEQVQNASDGSQISTMFDGYGNKSEIRSFEYHPLIKKIVVRTLPNNEKQIFVYGQNGEVKTLPANKSENILVASGNSIAGMVQITESRIERDKRRAEIAQRKNENYVESLPDTNPENDQMPIQISDQSDEKRDKQKDLYQPNVTGASEKRQSSD